MPFVPKWQKTFSSEVGRLSLAFWSWALQQRNLKSQLSWTHFFRQPVVIFKEVLFIGLYDCVFYISSWTLLYICCSSLLLGILFYHDIFLPHTSRFLSNLSCLGHVFKYLCVHSSFQLLDLMWPRKISSLLRLLSICCWVVSVV